MSLSILGMLGETMSRAMQSAMKPFDGSSIGIQTDKGSYTAGETVQGFVVLQNNSVRQIDHVVVMVSVVERTRWDEETARTHTSGEGDNRKTWTEYSHSTHVGELTHLKERVVVSNLAVQLTPGAYSYPFSYPLRADLPGCARYHKTSTSHDPKRAGRPLETLCEVVYLLEAHVDVHGAFDSDLSSRQELTVNPAFNWASMAPAVGQKHGQVLFCCCFPQGEVLLTAAFDRAAYMAGETAQIKATIKNDSESDVAKMSVKLIRTISMRASSGQRKNITDVMCRQTYPGVPKKSPPAGRDMPLPLSSGSGGLLPGTKGQLVDISYTFQVACEVNCAPEIEVHLPMVVFAPSPATWGLAALGQSAPQGMTFSFAPSAPPAGGYAPAYQQPIAQPQQQYPPQQQQQQYPPQQQQYPPQQQQQYPPQQQQYPPQPYPPQPMSPQQGGYSSGGASAPPAYPQEGSPNPAYGVYPPAQPLPQAQPPQPIVTPIMLQQGGGM